MYSASDESGKLIHFAQPSTCGRTQRAHDWWDSRRLKELILRPGIFPYNGPGPHPPTSGLRKPLGGWSLERSRKWKGILQNKCRVFTTWRS